MAIRYRPLRKRGCGFWICIRGKNFISLTDRLVRPTGARSRKLDIPGEEAQNIFSSIRYVILFWHSKFH